MNAANILILLSLAEQYATKTLEIGRLFRAATERGGDVTDEEVERSTISRDVALARTQSTIDDEQTRS